MFDGKAFGEEMVAIVRDFVASELQPVLTELGEAQQRIAELEAREIPDVAGLLDAEAVNAIVAERSAEHATEVDALRADIAALSEDKAALVARIAELEAREIPDVAGLLDAEAVGAIVAERSAEHATEVDALRADVAALSEDKAALVARIAELEAREIPDVAGLLDAEAVNAIVAERSAEHATEVDALRADIAALSEDKAALVARIAELEAREIPDVAGLLDAEAVGAIVVERSAEHATEVDALRADVAALSEDKAALVARIAELEAREIPDVAGLLDADQVRALLAEALPAQIAEAVALLPSPKDGESCDMAEVERMLAELVTRAVAALPPPKDGVGLASAFKDHEGCLILTMTDGSTRSLGRVDGRDGETFTLDDFDIEQYPDGRTFKFCFTRGEAMHSFEFRLPVPIYREVYKETESYERGDLVTWAGSLWHCNSPSTGKAPGAIRGDEGVWTLAARKGRDGKDAPK